MNLKLNAIKKQKLGKIILLTNIEAIPRQENQSCDLYQRFS